ncbi:hypothetical protein F7R25_04210 [Burkholderia stagnalis]|uniref:Uncharacterized protein n=1 Tax=Burkholderia stagnalis TaxID=1503054 RepID=A0A6L3N3W8_9BURK|nr:hypothetical protein [Burkholderia stagnalis]KAB0640709.1 hypothetical protein F7R25_04210 [Burkholderia stagnalis]VWB06873.1 hypothetical protein BST28156_00146 [Burkholderia stagnalis]
MNHRKRYNSKLEVTLTVLGITSTTNYIGRIWANSQEEADATFKDMITDENGKLDWKKLEVMLEYRMAHKETV